jgi:hypothetical protein
VKDSGKNTLILRFLKEILKKPEKIKMELKRSLIRIL